MTAAPSITLNNRVTVPLGFGVFQIDPQGTREIFVTSKLSNSVSCQR
jgi:hypothetical protein